MVPTPIVISKALDDAKGRLAKTFPPKDRRRLTLAMATQVMEAVASSKRHDQRIFVSPDAELLSLAEGKGFSTLHEGRSAGMNVAFRLGIEAATTGDDAGVLLLPSDLPLLQSGDVDRMASLVDLEGGVAILPSPGGGTSALGLRPAAAIPLHFEEPSSDELHRRSALEAGVPLAILRWPEAGLDLDGPEDLHRLWASSRPSAVKQLLLSMGHGPEALVP